MPNTEDKPVIVGFVADLMFTSKIETVTRHLGFEVKWVAGASEMGEVLNSPPERPGESLHGREGQLFERITAWQPALLLFDLTNRAVPWQEWIAKLKSSPATRRIPVMAFGPHEDSERLQQARRVGAEHVYARSRFFADLPLLLERHAHIPDQDALQESCQEPLSPLARQGIALFNQGHYYKCHDDLEEAWRQDESNGRDLYQGILQVGIAYFQIERGNYRGAVKMLLRARQWLEPLPAICRGVDVAGVRQNAVAIYETILALGPERIGEFDMALIEPIVFED